MISLISALAPIVGDIVKEAIPDPDKKRDAENKVRLALLENSKQLEASASQIVLAEAKSESWIARSWRPILMLNITAIVSVNYLIFPLIEVTTGSKMMIPLNTSDYCISLSRKNQRQNSYVVFPDETSSMLPCL